MTVPSSMLGGQKGENRGKRKKKKAWCGSALRFLWRGLRGMAIQLFRSMLLGGVDVCWCCRDIGLLHDKILGSEILHTCLVKQYRQLTPLIAVARRYDSSNPLRTCFIYIYLLRSTVYYYYYYYGQHTP